MEAPAVTPIAEVVPISPVPPVSAPIITPVVIPAEKLNNGKFWLYVLGGAIVIGVAIYVYKKTRAPKVATK